MGGIAKQKEQIEHEVGHLRLADSGIFRLNRQVSEEGEVRLEAEEVDRIATFSEESLVPLSDERLRVVEERLGVECVCVEVERQDALIQDGVEPECNLLAEDDLEDADENF